MPGEEIEHSCQRLTNETERNPEDEVSYKLAIDGFHLRQWIGEDDERELEEHACEGDALEYVSRLEIEEQDGEREE